MNSGSHLHFDIALRCVSRKSKGFGNFRRSLILYEILTKNSKKPLLIIDDNPAAKKLVIKKHINFKIIPKHLRIEEESKKITEILKLHSISKIILDVREIGEKLSKKLSSNDLIVISIDDAWIKNVYSNMIINVTGIEKYSKYIFKKSFTKSYFGDDYFITEKNFSQNKKSLNSIHLKKIYNVTITMGGSDPNDLTKWILEILLKNPTLFLTIIVGPFYTKTKSLIKLISNYNNCKIIFSPPKIWTIFKNSDLVITNAGNTLFELTMQGVPNVSIVAFRHQKPYAEYFSKRGSTVNLGYKSNISKTFLETTIIGLLKNPNLRKKMSRIGPKIIDGYGAERVCNLILSIMKKR